MCRSLSCNGEIFVETKKKYSKISIRYPANPGYILSDMYDRVISENGFHTGINYNNVVFCNVHPYGLPKNQWINDFIGLGPKIVEET